MQPRRYDCTFTSLFFAIIFCLMETTKSYEALEVISYTKMNPSASSK